MLSEVSSEPEAERQILCISCHVHALKHVDPDTVLQKYIWVRFLSRFSLFRSYMAEWSKALDLGSSLFGGTSSNLVEIKNFAQLWTGLLVCSWHDMVPAGPDSALPVANTGCVM